MSIASNKPVLVTGVTGFVAAWVALELLRRGYTVRGTARSKAKFDALLSHNSEFSKYAKEGKLTFTPIEDVATSDFSEALKDVEIVMHTASPFHMSGGPAEETYLKPALNGTRNVIEAAHKAGTVKSFVVTSSFAAVLDLNDSTMPHNGKTFTEKDWNPVTYEQAKDTTNAAVGYCASKKVAEEYAHNYMKEHKLEGKMNVCAMNPPMVMGPFVHAVDDLSQLNESLKEVYATVAGKTPDGNVAPTSFPAAVDVRDLAIAHVNAAEHGSTGRFLLYSGAYDYECVAAKAQKEFPDLYKGPKNVDPSKGLSANPKTFTLDTTRARKELGMSFRPVDTTFHEMVESILKFKGST